MFGLCDVRFFTAGGAGKKSRLLIGSTHLISFTAAWPERTSISPAFASGANCRVNSVFRRLQSIRRTLQPESAIISARFAATTLFPSPGRADVTPTILLGRRESARSAATFKDRIVSAKRENG